MTEPTNGDPPKVDAPEPPPSVTTLGELEAMRELEPVLAPSGNYYRIRPLNLDRHALAGGLPSKLREIGLQGVEGINRLFADDDTLAEAGAEARVHFDRLVASVIVKPSLLYDGEPRQLPPDHEGADPRMLMPGDPDPDKMELLPPVDYKWSLGIAYMEVDRDGEGRLLWGRESLDRWATFREEHDCSEDCARCARVRRRFSATLGRPV